MSSDASCKRRSYPAKFKLNAIKLAKVNGNRGAARELNVDEKRIREWRKQESVLKEMPREKRAQRRGPEAHWPDLENELCSWIENQRKNGRSLSTVLIRIKAKQMADEKGYDDFLGGPSWCNRFFKRNGLTMRSRTTVGQKLPDDWQEKKASFLKFVKEKIEKLSLKPFQIGNMDEVPVSFDMPTSRSADFIGVKSVPVITTGNEKNCFTVVLSCMASGEKLPPMVIFKRKTLPKESFPKGIVVSNNERGWMNLETSIEWAEKCWRKRPNSFFQRNSLLVMDSMQAHRTADIKKSLASQRTEPAIIPGGLTKLLQPLDVSLNRSFKAQMRNYWEQWMAGEDHEFTKGGHMRRATYAQICQWIVDAWEKIPQKMVQNAFIKSEIIQGDIDVPSNLTSDMDCLHDNDDTDPDDIISDDHNLSSELIKLFTSDTEDEDFDGFSDVDDKI